MSAPEVKTKKYTAEVLNRMEDLSIRISESLKKEGLPQIDGVKLQKEHQNTPISQEVKDRHQQRLARWAARKNNQS